VSTQTAPPAAQSGRSAAARVGSRWPLAAIAVLASAVAQAPTLGHFFRSDDFLHLYQIVDQGFVKFAFNTHGGHLLFTSNTFFYVWHALFGLHAEWYYLLALVTHLLNVVLLFRVVEVSYARPGLALAAALLWGTSGLNQGSVGWFSVYGHVLVATWTLWWLYDVARIARNRQEPTRGTLVRWWFLLLGAATSFGTGIPIAMLSGAVVYLLLPGRARRTQAVIAMSTLVIAIPCIYLACQVAVEQMLVDPASVSVLALRIENLAQPSNWLPILSFLGRLVAHGIASLLTGPLLIVGPDGVALGPLAGAGIDVVSGASFAAAAAVLGFALAVLYRSSKPARQRLIAYGILLTGCYAMIAVGRALFFEHHGVPLAQAAVEPRYHYVAHALAALLLVAAVAELPPPRGRLTVAVTAAWLAVIVASALGASRMVNTRLLPPDGLVPYREAIAAIEDAIESRPLDSTVHVENRSFPEAGVFNQSAFPGWAALFIITYPRNEIDGRRVYFVERNAELLEITLRRGGPRINDLLVGPGEQ